MFFTSTLSLAALTLMPEEQLNEENSTTTEYIFPSNGTSQERFLNVTITTVTSVHNGINHH